MLPWAGISPPSQSEPVFLYPFHQKVLFLLPESSLLQVGPVPTYTAMEIVWFPLLAEAFYALHLTFSLSFFLRFTLMSSKVRPLVGFSLSYLQMVLVFLNVAQIQGTHSGLMRQLHLPCSNLGEKTPILVAGVRTGTG